MLREVAWRTSVAKAVHNFQRAQPASHPRVELTAVTRCRMFMVEGMFADETDVYAMGVLIMQALADPSVEATHCNLQRLA